MVKKLLKHEITAFSRTILPIYIIMLGIALLTRFVQLFENDTVAHSVINVSSIVMLCVAITVCLIMTFFTGITRFYKNLFTSEGYLSLTLPVTAPQHIYAKLIIAVLFNIVAVIAAVISVLIATLGDVANEIIKAAEYIVKIYFDFLGAHGVSYVIEVIVLLIVSVATSYLLFYACISIGQLAKKNRVLAAFGTYFGYYIICQILGTVLIILLNGFVNTDLYNSIMNFIENNLRVSVDIGICGYTVYTAVLGLIYYLVTYKIMTKKLNIE